VVAPGTPVVKLARAGAREAVIAIPETAIQSLPRDAVATIYGSHDAVPAHLREVSGSADPVTRTFSARFPLEVAEQAAPLGATVTVRMGASASGAVTVPLAALHDDGRGPGVWIVGPDRRVTFRPVTVRALGEESIEIALGEVHSGEEVVALGAQLLREGEVVRTGGGQS
jgi:multidrug efflux pump subunit AcrA (membrane-fusion protein)